MPVSSSTRTARAVCLRSRAHTVLCGGREVSHFPKRSFLEFKDLRCVRVARRAPVDLDLCAGFERTPGDVQTP